MIAPLHGGIQVLKPMTTNWPQIGGVYTVGTTTVRGFAHFLGVGWQQGMIPVSSVLQTSSTASIGRNTGFAG
jgi:hypothetical protein